MILRLISVIVIQGIDTPSDICHCNQGIDTPSDICHWNQGIEDTSHCNQGIEDTSHCNQGIEDTSHFLFPCPSYANDRAALLLNVNVILRKMNLNHLRNQLQLYLYGHPS